MYRHLAYAPTRHLSTVIILSNGKHDYDLKLEIVSRELSYLLSEGNVLCVLSSFLTLGNITKIMQLETFTKY